MSLKVKRPCICTMDNYIKDFHPTYVDYPELYRCPFCNGKKEVETYPDEIDLVNGFEDVNWDEVHENWSEDMMGIVCVCGDEVILSSGENRACSCGRVYHLSPMILTVNKTFVGKVPELLEYIKKE